MSFFSHDFILLLGLSGPNFLLFKVQPLVFLSLHACEWQIESFSKIIVILSSLWNDDFYIDYSTGVFLTMFLIPLGSLTAVVQMYDFKLLWMTFFPLRANFFAT